MSNRYLHRKSSVYKYKNTAVEGMESSRFDVKSSNRDVNRFPISIHTGFYESVIGKPILSCLDMIATLFLK